MSDSGYEDETAQPLIAPTQDQTASVGASSTLSPKPEEDQQKAKLLYFSFFAMLVVGLGNKIFQVLQAYPMENYPYFLNLLTTFIYVPLSFAYIIPMIYCGTLITPEQRAIPQYKFAVMGALDGIAGMMQTFAINYLRNGGLITLLMQSAIPLSMIISKLFLKVNYKTYQYAGAVIVAAGITIVLLPEMISSDSSGLISLVIWSSTLILSCIPMTLSSVYKEKALGEVEIDVVYLNGYVAVYQLMIALAMAVPSGYAASVSPQDIPENIADGFKCFLGISSSDDDHCGMAPVYVSLYMFFNVLYNILIIMILKYGSSNLLWLAMTVMVPLVNVSFSLPFVPKHKPMEVYDIVGLIVIMSGLIIFRFYSQMKRLVLKVAVACGFGRNNHHHTYVNISPE